MSVKILFNGQEYDSVEAMPAEVRYAYEEVINVLADNDHNGIPDILEQGAPGALPVHKGEAQVVITRVNMNGQKVDNLNDLPGEVRQALEQINVGQNTSHNPPANPVDAWPPPSAPIVPPVTDTPKGTDPRLILALGVIAVLLLIILGMVVFGFVRFAH